jgi:predicted amidohydrolase YtcJ
MSLCATRRRFLGASGAVIGAGALVSSAGAQGLEPDLIVVNARVYTVDDAAPRAQGFAVRSGRFLAVGSSSDMRSLAGPRTQVIDAQGMTITPGFIDCHNHADGEMLLYDVLVGNPFEVEFVTIDSIIDKLTARACTTPADTWVAGEFFDDTKVKDARQLTVHDLDRVSTTQPVAVHHRGGHTAFYNTKALQMAGIGPGTKNPPGGTYDRFPDGSLNGRVTDRAMETVESVGLRAKLQPGESARRAREGMAHISKKFVEYGLTGVCHEGGDLSAIEAIRGDGRLLHRVTYEAADEVLEAMVRAGITSGLGDEWLRIGATIEHTADGSFSERTMALSRPYPGSTSKYQGNVTETQEDLDAWVERLHRAGFQVNCHANGDVGIDHVLTSYERAAKAFPVKDARWKITHCSLATPPLIARIKALDATPALFSTYSYYNADKFHFYGEDLMRNIMPYRSMIDAGVKVCAGSDFQPGPFSPMMALQAMVTRKGWNGEVWGANQKITVAEALRVHTLNGAYDTKEERLKGSITPGKLADFVMLSDDPHTIDVEKIKDIKVVRTVVGGTTQHQL